MGPSFAAQSVLVNAAGLPKPAACRQIRPLKNISTTFRVCFAVITLLLAGCVHYQPKPLSLDESADAFDRRSLSNEMLQAFVAAHLTNASTPITEWNVDSLTLAAFYSHPALRVAYSDVELAAAGKRTASGRLNPTATVSPGYNFDAVSPTTPWIPGLTIDMPIETAGKRHKRISQAQQLALAAQFSALGTAWQVRSNVQVAVIETWAATERERHISNQITNQAALLRLLEQQLAAGAITQNELRTVQLAQVRLQSDAAAARTAVVQARAHLAESLAMPMTSVANTHIDEAALKFDPTNFERAKELRAYALRHRVDLLAALARYEAAQSALQLEIAKQYPDIHIGSGYQWDQGESKWTLSVGAELPIFNRNQGPIAEAEARRKLRAAEAIDAQTRAINEIDRALDGLATARQENERALQAVEMLAKQIQATRERFAAGAADQAEVQAAIVDESAAALVALDTRVRALFARAQLEAALQIPSAIMNATVEGLASR